MTERFPIRIVAIVPLSDGSDELLMFPASDSALLPTGELREDESLLDAAARVVLEQAGFRPIPERVVYLLEGQEHVLTVGVLCSLPPDAGDTVDLKGEFVSVSRFGGILEPFAFREILMEDTRSGFVRPMAHIVEVSGEGLQISW